MKTNRFLRIILIILILAIVIGCDQATKAIIKHKFQYYDLVTFLHKHIVITRVENSGAFLGMGDSLNGPLRNILLNILPLLAVLYGLYYIFSKTNLNRVTLIAIILIVGGGLGNLYDRMLHGTVTDFLHIDFVIFQTGVFNVADICITTGAAIILIHSFLKKPDVEEKEPEKVT